MAKSIMNKKVLAVKVKTLEEIISNETTTDEEKIIAKEKMGELISSIMKLPGGMDLLLKMDDLVAPEIEKN